VFSGREALSRRRAYVLSLSCEPASHGDGTSGAAAAATNDASAARFAAAVTPPGTAEHGRLGRRATIRRLDSLSEELGGAKQEFGGATAGPRDDRTSQ